MRPTSHAPNYLHVKFFEEPLGVHIKQDCVTLGQAIDFVDVNPQLCLLRHRILIVLKVATKILAIFV